MKATNMGRIAAGCSWSALLLSGALFACAKDPDEASSAAPTVSRARVRSLPTTSGSAIWGDIPCAFSGPRPIRRLCPRSTRRTN